MVSPLLLAILATEKVDINREGGSPKEQKRGKGKSKSEGSREHTWLRASGVGLQEGLNPEQVPRDNGIIMRFSFVSAPDGARHRTKWPISHYSVLFETVYVKHIARGTYPSSFLDDVNADEGDLDSLNTHRPRYSTSN